MRFQDLKEGTKSCGFGLGHKGQALPFLGLETRLRAAGFWGSGMGTKRAQEPSLLQIAGACEEEELNASGGSAQSWSFH